MAVATSNTANTNSFVEKCFEKRKLPLVGSAILLYVATKMLISIPFRESNAETSLIPNSFHLAHPVLWI
jgi:hypothetical protein